MREPIMALESTGVLVKEPHNLRTTLAVMKSAREKGVNMNIWERDIIAVEEAIAVIEALRSAMLKVD